MNPLTPSAHPPCLPLAPQRLSCTPPTSQRPSSLSPPPRGGSLCRSRPKSCLVSCLCFSGLFFVSLFFSRRFDLSTLERLSRLCGDLFASFSSSPLPAPIVVRRFAPPLSVLLSLPSVFVITRQTGLAAHVRFQPSFPSSHARFEQFCLALRNFHSPTPSVPPVPFTPWAAAVRAPFPLSLVFLGLGRQEGLIAPSSRARTAAHVAVL